MDNDERRRPRTSRTELVQCVAWPCKSGRRIGCLMIEDIPKRKAVWLCAILLLIVAAGWVAGAIYRRAAVRSIAVEVPRSLVDENLQPFFSPAPSESDVRLPLTQFLIWPFRDLCTCEIRTSHMQWTKLGFLVSDFSHGVEGVTP